MRAELSRVAARFGADGLDFVLERPRDAGHGDLATNIAMLLARRERANPRKTAERVLQELKLPPTLIAKTEIAGPGFINFWLAEDQLANAHQRILKAGAEYGRAARGAGLKVNVEFVSANPTGPLHVGHGRGAALGDAIASLLEWTGHAVTREFYVNDAGVQIDKAAQSLWARVRRRRAVEADDSRGRLPWRVHQGECARWYWSVRAGFCRSPARRRPSALPRAGGADAAGGAGPGPGAVRRATSTSI